MPTVSSSVAAVAVGKQVGAREAEVGEEGRFRQSLTKGAGVAGALASRRDGDTGSSGRGEREAEGGPPADVTGSVAAGESAGAAAGAGAGAGMVAGVGTEGGSEAGGLRLLLRWMSWRCRAFMSFRRCQPLKNLLPLGVESAYQLQESCVAYSLENRMRFAAGSEAVRTMAT